METFATTVPGHPGVADQCSDTGRCRSVCQGCKVRLFAVCSALSDDDIVELETLARQTQVNTRQPVLFASDPAHSVFTVTSGFIRLQRDLADGRRQIIGFLAPGDFIGLDLAKRYSYSADALTDVTLCRFDRSTFSDLVHRKPQLLEKLHQMTAHELSIAQDHMVLLGRRRAEERVALFLFSWRSHLKKMIGHSPTLPLPMSRQDIADHLGLTIETVSRIFARMGRDKIILDVPGGVRLLNEQGLSELAAA